MKNLLKDFKAPLAFWIDLEFNKGFISKKEKIKNQKNHPRFKDKKLAEQKLKNV